MILVFLSGAQALGVHHHHVDHLVLLVLENQRLPPHPDSFCLRVGRRPHRKSPLLFEHDRVQQVALSRAVHSGNGNDGDFALDGFEEGEGFGVGLVLPSGLAALGLGAEDERNCLLLIFFHLNL